MSKSADFTHLHVHSEFSLLDGMSKIESLLDETQALGMDSIAIRPRCYVSLTIDHRAMDGAHANRFLGVFIDALQRPG